MYTSAEIDEQIANLREQIRQNEAATTKARESFQHSLDSGQSRVSVTRQQLDQLRRERRDLQAELRDWLKLKRCSGPLYIRPGW